MWGSKSNTISDCCHVGPHPLARVTYISILCICICDYENTLAERVEQLHVRTAWDRYKPRNKTTENGDYTL